MILRILLILITAVFFGCAEKTKKPFTTESQLQKYNKKVVSYEYKIQPGDRLSIVFFRHPELSTKDEKRGILVSKNGNIVLPIIGRIKVSGLTKSQLQELLEKKYSRYVRNPNIYIEVLNKRIYVLGEVRKPGVFHITDDKVSLIEVLSKSGDLTDYGKREVYIIKGGLKNPVVLRINLSDINSLATSNLYLQPEDIVYIPPKKMKNINLAINGALPLLNLVGGILSSFVDIKYLSQ